MTNLRLQFLRPLIWLRRFRHRCGYGVHSPFAFGLITDVIYESRPYYAYRTLAATLRDARLPHARKVCRLLFRLANRVQPDLILETGRQHPATAAHLQAARSTATYRFVQCVAELPPAEVLQRTLLYLNDYNQPQPAEELFLYCAPHMGPHSLCVVHGIRYSAPMRQLWSRLQESEWAGVTFDLYDVGLIFFDRTKIKQHYLVNF